MVTASGVFPKSNGDIYYAPDANVAMANKTAILKNLVLQQKEGSFNIIPYSLFFIDGFYNTSLIASSTNWTNNTYGKNYWTSTNSSELIAKAWTVPSTASYATAYVDWDIYETYDELNNSSLDSALWNTAVTNTGSVTETSSVAILGNDNTSGSTARLYSKNNNLSSTVTKFWFRTYSTNTAGTAPNTGYGIYLSAANTASPTHTIFESGNNPGTQNYEWELILNSDAASVIVNRNGVYYTTVDISSNPTHLAINFYAYNTSTAPVGQQITLTVYFTRKLKPTGTSTLATSVSADAGSHYTAVTRENQVAIGTTGTQLKVKNVATIASGEYIMIRGYGVEAA